MELKLFLNKFLKADNIEFYSLDTLFKLRSSYDKFLESSKGTDPDFPFIDFGDKGKKIKGVNKTLIAGQGDVEYEDENSEMQELLNLKR